VAYLAGIVERGARLVPARPERLRGALLAVVEAITALPVFPSPRNTRLGGFVARFMRCNYSRKVMVEGKGFVYLKALSIRYLVAVVLQNAANCCVTCAWGRSARLAESQSSVPRRVCSSGPATNSSGIGAALCGNRRAARDGQRRARKTPPASPGPRPRRRPLESSPPGPCAASGRFAPQLRHETLLLFIAPPPLERAGQRDVDRRIGVEREAGGIDIPELRFLSDGFASPSPRAADR
jgi:hypothetical protein